MAGENNRNAYVGRNVETLFRNSINDYPSVLNNIKKHFGINGEFLNASGGGIYGDKADARINFAGGHYVDANIKAYKNISAFNQLTRTTVSNFCKIFSFNDDIKADLESLVVAKSKDTANPLFDDKAIMRWEGLIKEKAKSILIWGFSNKPSREIIVLFDRDDYIFRIYPMAAALNKLSTKIEFTIGGFNIGDCVSFQRKGGNGSLSKTTSKYDIKHPGNNVQLKLKIHKFIKLMEGIKLGEYSI
ncbi:hypothetical protein CV658_05775 [Borreliella burgdorferi]|uniref:Uncharacterized protein n=1 Tax=Borreliella burgdorferi 118a TaxID=476210 RepID=A0A7U4DIT6_BORBG|nr:hypothetical protein [Borreliella burgdorferi]ACL34337.1 hypothetical protein Bbu156a_Y13 [Borreliella burgdorferi 156a]ACN23901.1 hypothetical protein BBU64B_Y0009 [Borreliella burgdorferi 64b]ACN92749.1 hypothetical protein BBU118A_Y08 [Borreliella burgdorferi 118a]ADQ29943.1 hypothetical protein BbuN40_Y06 [Borreliella burgdorferi N40]PRQ97327.1 hypothetical protein CV674_05490 [Borreliella burgdorferi]